ncbi:glycosyltransferase family 2 protein [Latilactobacillus sakei]|uniref:glycosyltransferase family 2 protein n=1 Tax=Latilactobacillus sakei TaxID=1599 RepID=UPI0020735D11|nr:glycosyltransferase [Latilactobacillus sakei]USG06536.1 hypothetical protein A4W88_07915 [Latilactobacillus sakei]
MICFVLINYNAADVTTECVNNIKKLNITEKRIIIIDNCSPNKSGEKLRQKYSEDNEVVVEISKQNLGFARGNNLGFTIAKKYNPEFIVVMNNDMEIQTIDFEQSLKQSYAKNNFDILGPDVYSVKYKYHQNPQRELNYSLKDLKKMRNTYFLKVHMKFIFWIKWYLLSRIKTFKKEEKKTLVLPESGSYPLHGSFYVLSRGYFKDRDTFFYDKTFMYMESYILHYEVKKNRNRMIYDPSIKVDHFEDVSTDRTFSDGYKKAIFTNKCMLDSCQAYINLIEKDRN